MKKLLLFLMFLATPAYAIESATTGTMWKQEGTVVSPADDVTLVTGVGGGVEEDTDVSFTSIQVEAGSAAAPSIDVGGNNSGLSEPSPGTLGLNISGGVTWSLGSNFFHFEPLSFGPGLYGVTASETQPTLLPVRGWFDTGIGGAFKQVSLITGGIEAFSTYTTYSEFYPSGTGQVRMYDDGSLEAEGNITFSGITTIFADYSAINKKNQILCDATAGDVNIYIVSASGAEGRIGNVKKIDTTGNNCIIEPAGAETIDWVANRYISTRGENITYFSDNTNLLVR